MTSFHIPFLAVALLFFSSTSFASSKQEEAASLLEHARQLSDIRSEGAPAFRLAVGFKATKKDGSVQEGAYVEIWSSKAQWRKEIVAGNFRRTEVFTDQKRFLLEPVEVLPEYIRDVPALSEVGRFRPEAWRPEKLGNRKLNGASVRCIETLPVIRDGPRLLTGPGLEGKTEIPSLCFDKSSGLLAAEIEPETIISEGVACFFSDYQRFGDHQYARSYKCTEGKQPRLEARVLELVALPQADPELFTLKNGAKELKGCPDPAEPPRVVYQPEPEVAPGSGIVTLSILVGIDGIPRDFSTVSSPNPKQEKAVLEAVRRWRFRPATCDREPVEVKIAVEIESHIQ